MGRFHRHDDRTAHEHDDLSDGHVHDDHVPDDHVDGGQEHARPTDHGDLSGYRTAPQRVDVLERIFGENDRCAAANRELLDAYGVVAVNVMSSPGAGKTSLLEHTLAALAGQVRVGVVVGDIETSLDADRLAGHGAQVVLLNTSQGFGGECHLDAPMVASALARVDLEAIDLLFVENVGNLVCPAEFDVGAHHRVMVSAITEGEEKPLKYPVMFRSVDLVIVNKMDLLPHLDVDLSLFERNLAAVNPTAAVLKVSARTKEGIDDWVAWVRAVVSTARARDIGHRR